MFKIQGADQKEYGPVSTEVLRQWILERRADGRTLVQAAGTTDWRPLAEFPEFAAALATGPRPPTPPAPGPVPMPRPVGPPTTSGMAVASLVLGILGFCTLFTSFIGLPLGIISLVKIKGSGGRLEGQGLAIAGICTSAVCLLMIPVLVALMIPAFYKARQSAQTAVCVTQMKQLAMGVRLYANDNKDTLPPADAWCDAVQSYVGGSQTFQCKADTSGRRSSFAFNKNVAGRKEAEVDPRTVLLFEVASGGSWNVSGGRELMMPQSRHGQTVVVGFADGSVQQLPANRLNTLRWEP
jgi:prepilin-type processing-associated H-X9-DG protein